MHLTPRFGLLSYLVLVASLTNSFLSIQNVKAQEEWPQFRGPTGQGLAAKDARVPAVFSEDQNVKWKTPIPGRGWSSPVISGNHIWLTTAVSEQATPEEIAEKLAKDRMAEMKEVAGSIELHALCLMADSGKILHDIVLAKFDEVEPIHTLNSYASPTPVLAGDKVLCDFGNYGTWCLHAETGEELWKARYEVNYSVGAGSSPFVLGNRLVLVCDGIDDQFVAGLDLQTGKEVWRTSRPIMDAADVEFEKAYSTPVAAEVDGKYQVIVPAAQWICGYDPEDGHEIWRVRHGRGFSLSPSPIVVDDLVIFSTGYMRADLVAVRLGGEGDVTDSHIAWRLSRGVPNKPSPIEVDGKVYMVSDSGILTQLDAQSGSIQWQERLGGNYSASPIYAGQKLFFSSHEGIVTVVQPGDKYQELAQNQLEGRLMASPAVLGNDLIIRSEVGLLRIGS